MRRMVAFLLVSLAAACSPPSAAGNGVTFGPGRVGQAAVFPALENGTADTLPRIRIPKAPSLALSPPMTLAAWVKPAATVGPGAYLPVITKGQVMEDFTLWLTQAGPDVLLNWGTDNEFWAHRENEATPALKPNDWNHLAAVLDGSAVRCYLNGAFQIARPLDRSDEDLVIGLSLPGNLEAFSGAIDEVRLYDKALAAENIAALAR